MRSVRIRHALLLSSLLVVAGLLGYGCTLDTEGAGETPDASAGSGGAGGTSGSGGTIPDAAPDTPPPDVVSPDVPCFPPDKVCGGKCVAFDDPDYGCGQDTCDPCEARPHAEVSCVNNECVVTGCETLWGECDANPINGCETPLDTLDNCGVCGTACSLPNAIAECSTGECKIEDCIRDPNGSPLFGDCNTNVSDGCEQSLRDLNFCGSCTALPCTVPSGTPSCATGMCTVNDCPGSTFDCDGLSGNGCEVDLHSVDNCGACGNVCGAANVSSWTCGAGTCEIAACDSPWGDCNNDDSDGCERNLNASVDHCGQCGAACSSDHTQSRTCAGGQCDPTCEQGYEDCNGPQPGTIDNGCETDVHTPANCGACGDVCAPANATPSCPQGVCLIGSCNSGWGDCDNDPDNGCETNTNTSTTNCGSCGNVCSSAGGTPTCNSGNCNISCQLGRGNCDGNIGNGCETNIANNASHCGGCGNACSTNHVPVPSCAIGSCNGSCQSGWTDCDNNKLTNGCEVNTASSPTSCGGCTNSCSANNIPTPTCAGGVCNGTCSAGFADCDTNKLTNGCEVNTTNTVAHCGGCGNACSTNNVPVPQCTTSTCTGACASGFADCDSNKLTNGCERPTSSDVDNCGGCGFVCSNSNVTTRVCSLSRCEPVCSDGWDDCDGPEPGDIDDGCETNTKTSVANCGTCNSSCSEQQGDPPANATWTCADGLCEWVCASTWTDCDGTEANGCECPSTFACPSNQCKCNDNSDCGSQAGATCNAGSGLCSCSGSSGVTVCAVGQVCDGSGGCE